MRDIMAMLMMMALIIAAEVAVLVFGWGLQPVSWWWIVGGTFLVGGIRRAGKKMIHKIVKDDEK